MRTIRTSLWAALGVALGLGACSLLSCGDARGASATKFTTTNAAMAAPANPINLSGSAASAGSALTFLRSDAVFPISGPTCSTGQAYTSTDGTHVVCVTSVTVADATLTGNGSGASPLGVALNHANTWTALQQHNTSSVNQGIKCTSTGAGTCIEAAANGSGAGILAYNSGSAAFPISATSGDGSLKPAIWLAGDGVKGPLHTDPRAATNPDNGDWWVTSSSANVKVAGTSYQLAPPTETSVSGWHTRYDVDFTTLPGQDWTANAHPSTVTVDGHNWTFDGTGCQNAGSGTNVGITGTGLNIQSVGGNACHVQTTFANLAVPTAVTEDVQVWIYFTHDVLTNGDWIDLGLLDVSASNAYVSLSGPRNFTDISPNSHWLTYSCYNAACVAIANAPRTTTNLSDAVIVAQRNAASPNIITWWSTAAMNGSNWPTQDTLAVRRSSAVYTTLAYPPGDPLETNFGLLLETQQNPSFPHARQLNIKRMRIRTRGD